MGTSLPTYSVLLIYFSFGGLLDVGMALATHQWVAGGVMWALYVGWVLVGLADGFRVALPILRDNRLRSF